MTTRWLFTFEAIDPKNPLKTWKVGVHERKFKIAQRSGHPKVNARLVLVAEVLQGGTERIYEGWCRPGKDEDCYVYVGRPTKDLKSATITTPPPAGMVFLVFVLADGSIDEWMWRPCSDENGGNTPDGVTGVLIWSQKQN